MSKEDMEEPAEIQSEGGDVMISNKICQPDHIENIMDEPVHVPEATKSPRKSILNKLHKPKVCNDKVNLENEDQSEEFKDAMGV